MRLVPKEQPCTIRSRDGIPLQRFFNLLNREDFDLLTANFPSLAIIMIYLKGYLSDSRTSNDGPDSEDYKTPWISQLWPKFRVTLTQQSWPIISSVPALLVAGFSSCVPALKRHWYTSPSGPRSWLSKRLEVGKRYTYRPGYGP